MIGEVRTVVHGQERVDVRVLRTPRKKTVALHVSPDLEVVLRVPQRLSGGRVEEILRLRADWIVRQVKRFRALSPPLRREFVSGESIPFLGEDLTLEVVARPGAVPDAFRFDVRLWVTVDAARSGASRREAVRSALVAFFRAEAAARLPGRVAHYAERLGVAVPAVFIRDQKRRWGSCHPRGCVYLNWRLVLMPPDLLDYVVAHEVCHLRRADHGPRFWALVGSLVPDVKERRARLRRDGERYSL